MLAPAGAPVLDGAGWCERGLPLRPLAAPDLATLNRLRAVEVSLLAVPADDRCPSLAAATRWAVEQVRASGLPLRVVADDRSGGVDGACFLPSTYWPDGVVLVDVSSLPAGRLIAPRGGLSRAPAGGYRRPAATAASPSGVRFWSRRWPTPTIVTGMPSRSSTHAT